MISQLATVNVSVSDLPLVPQLHIPVPHPEAKSGQMQQQETLGRGFQIPKYTNRGLEALVENYVPGKKYAA